MEAFPAFLRYFVPEAPFLDDVKLALSLCLVSPSSNMLGLNNRPLQGTTSQTNLNVLVIHTPSWDLGPLLEAASFLVPSARHIDIKHDEFLPANQNPSNCLNGNGDVLLLENLNQIPLRDYGSLSNCLRNYPFSYDRRGIPVNIAWPHSIFATTPLTTEKYNEKLTMAENTRIPSHILNKFDLFLIKDKSMQIIESKQNLWGDHPQPSIKQLVKGLDSSRKKRPEVSVDAGKYLNDFYSKNRSNLYNQGLPIPFCEDQAYSIIRIAHSYAKLCHHAKVSKYDMLISIQLFLQGWQYAAWDPDSGQMDVGIFYNGKSQNIIDIVDKTKKHVKKLIEKCEQSLTTLNQIRKVINAYFVQKKVPVRVRPRIAWHVIEELRESNVLCIQQEKESDFGEPMDLIII